MLICSLFLIWFICQYYPLPLTSILWACPLLCYSQIIGTASLSIQLCIILLYLLAWIDWQTGLLPDPLNLCLAILGLYTQLLGQPSSIPFTLLQMIGIYSLLSWVNKYFMQHRGIMGLGGGDIKLLTALCFWIDTESLLGILLLACLLALVHVGIYFLRYRQWICYLKFGPYLCLPSIWYFLTLSFR